MRRLRLALGALALLLVPAVVSAQSTITGRVADARGGPVATGDVTLRPLPPAGAAVMPNMPGMMDRTAQVTGGAFTLDQVAPGTYALFVDATGYERSSQELTVANANQTLAITLRALDVPGAAVVQPAQPTTDPQVLLERIRVLEQRLTDIESSAVLSDPETRVRQIEVYVDPSGVAHDEPVPGATRQVTYQRERVYRRQTINEKVEEAIAGAEENKVLVGVSAASVTQLAKQSKGEKTSADNNAYQLASADLFFTAGLAQYTTFFADIVGLSGAPPDGEIGGLTLLNAYTARLIQQNQINLREAWLRTELFSQKFSLTAGKLDLANFFDRNAAANDETAQFISDALVNNPGLGLSANGAGVVGVFDPKIGFVFKAGLQQSDTDATNLSDSVYSLAEVDYLARLPGLSDGNYRAWFRNDNSGESQQNAFGLSLDQKLNNTFMLFGRYGSAEAGDDRDTFYSAGFQIQNGLVVSPQDYWGVGYSQLDLAAGDEEKLVEGYYNFFVTDKLRLSFHLAHTLEQPAGAEEAGFLVPAIRLQASF